MSNQAILEIKDLILQAKQELVPDPAGDTQTPTPKDHIWVQEPFAKSPCDASTTIDSSIEYSLYSSL